MAIVGNLTILMTADVQSAERDIRGMSRSIAGIRDTSYSSAQSLAVYSGSLDQVKTSAGLAKEGIGFFGNAVSLVNPALGMAINNVERLAKDIGQLTKVAQSGAIGMQLFRGAVVAATIAMGVKFTVMIADWLLGVEKVKKALTETIDKAASQTDKINQQITSAYNDRIEVINLTKTGQERINELIKEEISLKKTLADNDTDIQAAQERVRQAAAPSVGKSIYRFFGGTADIDSAKAALENAQKIFKTNRDALLEIDKAKNPLKSDLDKARDFKKLKEEGAALAKTLQTPFEQFSESTARIIELAKAGAIDAVTAKKAIEAEGAKALKASAKSSEGVNIGSLARGTAAALSPFLKRTESADPTSKQILSAQLAATKALESIDKKLKPTSVVYTPVSF